MVAKQVQIRRDSATNLNASTPASGELGWDTTNKRVRGGDGTTAGGIYIPNRIDLQNQTMNAIDAGGTANALTLTFTTGLIPSAYVKYQRFVFKATATNTTTATLNVNSLGAKTLKKMSTAGTTALVGGEIYNGQTYAVVYDGTDMLLESVPVSSSTSQWTLISTATASGSATLDFTTGFSSTYCRWMWVIDSIYPATNNSQFYMRTSTDGGSTYDSGATDYEFANTLNGSGSSDSYIKLTGNLSNAGTLKYKSVIQVSGLLNSSENQKFFYISDEAYSTSKTKAVAYGSRKNTADIDAVRFLMSSGNISGGTIRMYGLRST